MVLIQDNSHGDDFDSHAGHSEISLKDKTLSQSVGDPDICPAWAFDFADQVVEREGGLRQFPEKSFKGETTFLAK